MTELLESAKRLAQCFERLDEEGFILSMDSDGDERVEQLTAIAKDAIEVIKREYREATK